MRLVGAAMSSTCWCGAWAAGHDALREAGSRPRARALRPSGAMGSPASRFDPVHITPSSPFPSLSGAAAPDLYAARSSGSR